ncbi:hypothetical protein MSG28_000081 [Choristoneura fumiferana]|uniref:Uncharacterized protein n=1 Tax=Choristoneura fumiferana TaxID=7141 RepID=A0ACC0JZ76_CHOFU|nr:hypothetical protein MSG28_000081 [Choristoneura fumiferana]
MLKDAAWGLAAVGCLLITLYSIDLGVTAWREFDKDDPNPIRSGRNYDWHYEFRANATDGRRAQSEPAISASSPTNITNKSHGNKIPPAEESEDFSVKPEGTASSPYLFQPIRYMNKEKRSVYREYKDGSRIVR